VIVVSNQTRPLSGGFEASRSIVTRLVADV
jgi:hypothetical protein